MNDKKDTFFTDSIVQTTPNVNKLHHITSKKNKDMCVSKKLLK